MKRLRSKRVAISGLLALGAVTLLATAQSWVTFGFDPEASAVASITVSGNQIAPLAFALALAALAGTAALTISGRPLSTIISIAITLCSAGISAVAILVAVSPVQHAQAQLTTATGLSGEASLAAYVATERTEIWLFVAIVASGFLLLAALIAALSAHTWNQSGARFRSNDLSGRTQRLESNVIEPEDRNLALADDRILDWDDLSHGRDPSAQDPR